MFFSADAESAVFRRDEAFGLSSWHSSSKLSSCSASEMRFSCQQADDDDDADDGDGDGGDDDNSGGQFAALVRGFGSLGLLLALCADG